MAVGFINPLGFLNAPRALSHVGLVPIPVSAVTIPAYTRITRDHLWNSKLGTFTFIYLRPDQVTPEMIRFQGGVIGRVMDHDKPPNYVFTEADFLPPGRNPAS